MTIQNLYVKLSHKRYNIAVNAHEDELNCKHFNDTQKAGLITLKQLDYLYEKLNELKKLKEKYEFNP